MSRRVEGGAVKLFISWSKPLSLEAAQVFRQWLPDVIQEIDTWASENDIDKGAKWSAAVSSALEETKQGILCVTPQNLREPWLIFEAGALAKSVATSMVSPVLFGLEKRDLTGPLAEFQATIATDREDMRRLLASLNKQVDRPLEIARLDRAFDSTWSDVEAKFRDISARALAEAAQGGERTGAPAKRSDDDVLAEVLERVRGIERDLGPKRAPAIAIGAKLGIPYFHQLLLHAFDGEVLNFGVEVAHGDMLIVIWNESEKAFFDFDRPKFVSLVEQLRGEGFSRLEVRLNDQRFMVVGLGE